MKYVDIAAKTAEELRSDLKALKSEYANAKSSHSVTPLENPLRLPMMRKDIARVQTALTQKSKES